MTFHSWRNLSEAQGRDGISPLLHSAAGNIDYLCTTSSLVHAEQEVH